MAGKQNRLIKETSPYLLQHAYNPVDWYPWGNEAFERAKKENKPIFLSVGYSSCHWCHVMEEESFENPYVAEYLNKNFVAIKVDREERPDIDNVYMQFAVLTTGSGGWPLSVFLTPENEPFFAGTYFPTPSQHGLQSFLEILEIMKNVFEQQDKKSLILPENIRKAIERTPGNKEITQAPLEGFLKQFLEQYDEQHGGFSGAPKFPLSLQLMHLLERKEHLEKVFHTLKKMGNGGIYDHLGGGFSRYSVDESWIVPHFEKMLYDNALLLQAYAKAYCFSNDEFFKEKADGVFDYVKHVLLQKNGFASGQDADSEGEEGRYYVFTKEEIERHTYYPELFCNYFSIEDYGNFEGKNVLFVKEGITFSQEQKKQIEEDKNRLRAYRSKRKAPAIDTKIIISWNALMVSGLVAYGRYCRSEDALTLARKVLDCILEDCYYGGKLLRISGKTDLPGFLEDYSFLIHALLDFYELSFDENYLVKSKEIAKKAIELFYNDGFSERSELHEPLYADVYSAQDNVMPSGVSMMIKALFRLNLIEHSTEYEQMIKYELERNMGLMKKIPVQYPVLLDALAGLQGDFYAVEISGGEKFVQKMHDAILQIPVFNMQIFLGKSEKDEIKICFKQTCSVFGNFDELKKFFEAKVR